MTPQKLLSIFQSGAEFNEEARLEFLELCVKAAVCELYGKHPKDVLNEFSLEQLENVVDSTRVFGDCRVEEMYRRALGWPKRQGWGEVDLGEFIINH